MPSLPPPAVRALLQHYEVRAREDSTFQLRIQRSWLGTALVRAPVSLGVADRSAGRLLTNLSPTEARRWRAEWRAQGLVRDTGREALTGRVVLPLIPARQGAVALASLPLAALADPRTLPVIVTAPGWIDLTADVAHPRAVIYACSDAFDALVVRALGLPALALAVGSKEVVH